MKKTIITFLIKFIVLSLYFNLLPLVFHMNDFIRFFQILLFFPIAYLLTKKFSGTGMESYGIVFYKGWGKNLTIGLLIGAIFWTILFGLYIYMDKFEFLGVKSFGDSIFPIAVILFGFGTGSLINDMIIRGMVFHHFKDKLSVPVVFLISILLYAFDDIWYAGFSLQNTVFSIVLGVSLTYSYYKANSIWVDTGIHFGLNIIYGIFYGVSGILGDGIFLLKEGAGSGLWIEWLSTIISVFIFIIVLLTARFIVIYPGKKNLEFKLSQKNYRI